MLTARTYTAKYRDGSNFVREVATGCRDEQAARSILNELVTRAVRVQAKYLTPAEDAVIDHQAIPLSVHFDAYREHLEASGTSESYRANTIAQLRRIAAECRFDLLANLDAAAVERWLAAKSKANVDASGSKESTSSMGAPLVIRIEQR